MVSLELCYLFRVGVRTSSLSIANIALVQAVEQKQCAKERQQNKVEFAQRASVQLFVSCISAAMSVFVDEAVGFHIIISRATRR